MFGIYQYQNGLQFTGIIAKTEEEAWAYLDKKIGKESKMKLSNGEWYYPRANRKAFEIKKIKLI